MADAPTIHFSIDLLDRQLAATAIAKRGLLVLLIVGWFGAAFEPLASTIVPVVCVMGAIVGWLVANAISNRTARMALQAEQLVHGPIDPDAAERPLAEALRRFTLYTGVRAALYHQLAVLRHRQGRADDAASICFALLDAERLQLGDRVRTKVRLLAADTSLQRGDVMTAWYMLCELEHESLDLLELMQRLELQTRYELQCGYHTQAMAKLPQKVRLAAVMPPPASASMHRLLADAARGCGCAATADWLAERARLLTGPTESRAAGFDDLAGPGGLAITR